METTTLLYISFAVIVSLFIAVFQYFYKTKERSQLIYWLSFFRFLSIFSILVLLINPLVLKKHIEIIKPILAVAVDNSTSIKYSSQDSIVKEFVSQLKEDAELNSKFSIKYYGFGKSLYTLDSLRFIENQTNLSAPFKEFSSIYKTASTPVVIITDGNQTVGNSIEFINYKQPVYPFVVGDTTIFEDLAINQLNVNKFTYINNRLPVELFITYSGKKPIAKNLTIYYKGKRVYSEKIRFSKADNVKTASFYLTATQKGIQYYNAKIEELENERHILNNSKNFSINVIDEQAKILILSAISHPDLGMFKKSIESNKQRSVSISGIAEYEGELTDYQLIILYQPIEIFENVFKEIATKRLNYFIVTGINTDWDFLNRIQTNFKKEAISETENSSPIFNTNYASFLSNDIGFSTFAPLEDKFGEVVFSIPYNTLLYQKIGSIITEKTLLATYESSGQKGAILLGENSWRWRMNSFADNKTFELYDGFISNIVQFLASNLNNKRLRVACEPVYYANEIVQFSASYLDENFNFDNRAKVWLTVSNKESNFIKKIPFTISTNRFIAELSNIPFGEYVYTVSVENQTEESSGNFKIEPFEVEKQFISSNDKQLKILVSKTKGSIYYGNQAADLIADLKSDKHFRNHQKITTRKFPLIDWKWILGFVVLTLSVEWFTRKYFGKI